MTAPSTKEALANLQAWCEEQSSKLGAVDGYDYRSGEEAAYRHAAIEIGKRLKALATLSPPAGERREAIALRRIVLNTLNGVAPFVENLACNQEQAEMDGFMVKVSRQALDAVLEAVNEVAIQAATASGLVQDEAGWRDISSAPKNHFPVLTWSEQGGRCVAFLDVTWTWWPCPATEPLSNKPTHWKPLPAPPIRSARDGGEA